MGVHRADEPDEREVHDHERGAVADEGQRNARDRHKAAVHADVLQNLEEPHADDPHDDEHAEEVVGAAGDGEARHDEQGVQAEKRHDAHEPELLGQNAEDEVRGGLGQKAVGRLRGVADALAEQATAPMAILAWARL